MMATCFGVLCIADEEDFTVLNQRRLKE